MTYAQVITALESRGIMPDRPPHLAPMERALKRAGLLDALERARAKSVIVAGTNGKGTTSATLSALIHRTGHSVGLYTSPHLVSTCERIRINERDISQEELTAAYTTLLPTLDAEGLSHFEALTLMAAWIFHSGVLRPVVEFTIWEVGLGGLFDATNAVPHGTCVITALGLDHQALLGNTLEEIAAQKFGVVGEGATVIYSPMPPELTALREATSEKTRSHWIPAHPTEHWGKLSLAIPGARAQENTVTALTTFEALGFDSHRHLSALAQVRWPGRFSLWKGHTLPCPVYLSGDHNPQGIQSLIPILRELRYRKLHLVVGIGIDKDAQAILAALCDVPRAQLHLTETPFKPLPLHRYPQTFLDQAQHRDPEVFNIFKALKPSLTVEDIVVVTGSLYLVGKILAAE